MVGLRGLEEGKQALYLGAGYSLWESRVDAQTEAATSRRHYWGRATSSCTFSRNDEVTSLCSDFSGLRAPPLAVYSLQWVTSTLS